MNENKEKKQKTISKSSTIVLIIITFFVGMIAMYGIARYFPIITETTKTKLEKDVTITDKGIADAVEKLYDSVVVVNTYIDGQNYASGTGFVYKTEDKKAYILTNNHVINNADEVYVTFTNDSVVKTTIEGSDVYSDIAVLSVSNDSILDIAEIGESKNTRLGDTVFAIGSPIDNAYSWSVTRGIVSGKDRLVEVSLSSGNTSTPMVVNTLQTDAAINAGNSGGPLANSNGEVIGITSIKLASEKIEGMGFAIPIENALDIASQLLDGKEIERPYLGIQMLDVTDVYSSFNALRYRSLVEEANVTSGVIVASVEKKSSAALAGIEANDIITEIDGKKVNSSAYLRYYLYNHKVGDEMKLTIIRNGKETEIKVKLSAN